MALGHPLGDHLRTFLHNPSWMTNQNEFFIFFRFSEKMVFLATGGQSAIFPQPPQPLVVGNW